MKTPVTYYGGKQQMARYIIENARIVDNFSQAIDLVDIVVGTFGVLNENARKSNRQHMTPKEFAEHAHDKDGRIGLVFGREDQGLFNG